jgi:hypothetical protein
VGRIHFFAGAGDEAGLPAAYRAMRGCCLET